jgi:hypothetical protein
VRVYRFPGCFTGDFWCFAVGGVGLRRPCTTMGLLIGDELSRSSSDGASSDSDRCSLRPRGGVLQREGYGIGRCTRGGSPDLPVDDLRPPLAVRVGRGGDGGGAICTGVAGFAAAADGRPTRLGDFEVELRVGLFLPAGN